MANQPPTNKNTIQNATVTAGGNIHIGDIYNPNSPLQPEKPKNTKNAIFRTVLIAVLGVGIGFLGELMPDNLKTHIETWVTANLHIAYWKFWIGMTLLFVLTLLWLTWKDALGDGTKAKTAAKDFEPEIRDWLKKRYQNRLDQKMAGRLPINLRRIDFSEGAAQIVQKQFKAIAPEDVQTELTEFFKTAEGRLLVVGAPGAGKTTLLLQLAVALLETQADALPAVVNLATWSSEFKTLDEWLKKILPVELGVSTALAVRLLAESRAILLFDGLDEISDAEQRKACLAAIDLFVSPVRPRREFVISSRTKEFREAGLVPLVSFPIEVGSLTMAQIEQELTRRDPAQPEDRDLLAALRNDQYLREAAETPFYFNCLQLLFGEGKRPLFSAGDQVGREREVLDAFVGNELGKCTKPETLRWLSFLASRMSERDLVRFELVDLQYNWYSLSDLEYVNTQMLRGFILSLQPTLAVRIMAGIWLWYLVNFWAGLYYFNSIFIKALYFNSICYALVSGNQPTIITNEIVVFSKKTLIGFLKKNRKTIVFITALFLLLLFISISHFFEVIRFCIFMWLTCTFTLYVIYLYTPNRHSGLFIFNKPYMRFIKSLYNLHFSIIQHFHLRLHFTLKKLLPYRFVHFLNELSNYQIKTRRFTHSPVHLMESDGASWRFRHRFIQEWFAEKWQEEQPKN